MSEAGAQNCGPEQNYTFVAGLGPAIHEKTVGE